MSVLLYAVIILVLLFGMVVLFGAPYLPTMRAQTSAALDLLALKKGQTLLELGCGDGRVLKAAARRGLKAVGYELNPLLVIIARLHTWQYRQQVRVIWGNYWLNDWPKADGIFTFLLDRYMKRLDKTITQKYKGKKVKLVSVAFQIPDKKPTKTLAGVFLYQYK